MLMFRPLIRFADFRGRARRAEYWLFVIFQGVVVGLCLAAALGSLSNDDPGRAVGAFIMWFGLAGLLGLVLFLPYLAVLARRLHDTDRSAWWMLLLAPGYLSPMLMSGAVGSAVGQMGAAGADQAAVGAALLSGLAGAGAILMVASLCNLALVILTLLPGTRGPNRFGPDPRDPHAVGGSEMRSVYDEDRLDELFAEARREGGVEDAGGGRPSRPAFDFGAGPEPVTAAPVRSVDWSRPAYDPGVAPSRPFGRRSG